MVDNVLQEDITLGVDVGRDKVIFKASCALENAMRPTAATIRKAVVWIGMPGNTKQRASARPNAYKVTENAWERNRGSPIAPPISTPRLLDIIK